jgi:hypothetical protein
VTVVAAVAPSDPCPPIEAERAGRERNEAMVRAETLKSARDQPA